jgi:Na+/H+-dicarboxylate symporter
VRRFVVGVGSFININGTLICVFVLAGLVVSILGIQISLLDLLFSIGVVFIIGYGVPGIPGELLMFGGPLAVLLRIQPDAVPIFLTLYLGLQIGLPDSFRTGANSTDDCVRAIILQEVYERKFVVRKKEKVPGFGLPGVEGAFATVKADGEERLVD